MEREISCGSSSSSTSSSSSSSAVLQLRHVCSYAALGWVAVFNLSDFWHTAATTHGPEIVWLVAVGGLAYTLGAVVYGTKWPNPSPRWFGFHEIFHSLTVVGFVCHYVAVSIAAYTVVH